ncbi:MAG: lipid-A-disaccharide synthase [Planctomycetes bacterium]|nr:lipid-A-disaccharide synthase [Planctomycetota bacterium]
MAHTLFLMAGEASGDLHGASLALALRALDPALALAGLGGPRMRDAGVEIVRDLTAHAAVGVSEALASVRAVYAAYRRMVKLLDERRPDAVVLIDYPEVNLRFARQAHRRGIKVAYYISPQVWAWREYRVKTIARCVDKLLVILPFEPDFYAKHGVEATFVGHPLLDILAPYAHDKRFAAQAGLPTGPLILGLLPGSRRKEIAALLPAMLGAAERIAAELGPITIATAPAPSVPPEHYNAWPALTKLPLHLLPGKTYELMAGADLLLIASGTATLEAGIIGTPMIVTYKVSRLSWALAKALVRGVSHCSLANLVAGRAIVSELLQSRATPDALATEALSLIRGGRLGQMARGLAAEVRPRLGTPGAAARAARHILDLIRPR